MLKFKFKFEQWRKVGLIRVKTAPINRWDNYKDLGVGIIAFGWIFNPVEFLQVWQKRKRGRGTMPAGPEQPQGRGPASDAAQPSRRARVRQIFKPDGRGPASVREGVGEGEDREADGRARERHAQTTRASAWCSFHPKSDSNLDRG